MYRVYTEDVVIWNGEEIGASADRIASTFFPAFTLMQADGYWNGKREKSAVIEVDTNDRAKVYEMAREMKIRLKQESVLVIEVPSKGELV